MLADTSATVAVLAAIIAPVLGLAGVLYGGRKAYEAQREATEATERAQQAANEATAVQIAQEILVGTIHEMRTEIAAGRAEIVGLRTEIVAIRKHHAECEEERRKLTRQVAELQRRR